MTQPSNDAPAADESKSAATPIEPSSDKTAAAFARTQDDPALRKQPGSWSIPWKGINMPKYRPEPERFWEKVDKTPTSGCWEWLGAIKSTGYGQFALTGRIQTSAHRWVYEHEVGPIEIGEVIDHRCHNRKCVNPQHLRAVTQKQNNENHSGPQRNNTSGHRGVYFETGTQRWVAQVRGSKTDRRYFQRFEHLEDAAAAVLEARNNLYTHNDLDRSTTSH